MMEQRNQEVIEIDIKELLNALLRKWWVIALIGILGAASVGAYTKYMITPMYSSTSKVYVINRQIKDVTTWSDLQSGEYIAKDLMILVKSRPVTEAVIHNLNLNITSGQLTKMITVNTPEETRIMEITVSNPDPQVAKQLVDAVAEVSSERMVSVMQMEKVNVVEEGNLPVDPSSPNLMKNIILGGLLGVVATSIIIITINILNDTIKTAEEIEKYLGITTLGIIPLEEVSNKKDRKHKLTKRKAKTALAS
jgi:capsular polysaccharide biosynthesis protein